MGTFLGLRYLFWALVSWVALAGIFGVILLYRVLISYQEQDELFMHPAEIRMTVEHIRLVNKIAAGFGIASAASLLLIGAGWALGVL
jgi:hypothetical protein